MISYILNLRIAICFRKSCENYKYIAGRKKMTDFTFKTTKSLIRLLINEHDLISFLRYLVTNLTYVDYINCQYN